MKVSSLGLAGLQGWRDKVANKIAGPVATRTSASEDQVRAAIGLLFLVLTLLYLIQTIKQIAAER